jgi:hypothetical protein
VGVVAHEAFRLVDDLVESPAELRPSGYGVQAQLDLGIFPQQEVMDRRRALQRAHLGCGYFALGKQDLASPICAFNLQHTRAQEATHHADDREESKLG